MNIAWTKVYINFPKPTSPCIEYQPQTERESDTRFSTSGFFLELLSPGPLSIYTGPFWIFSKIRGDIRKWMFITGVNDTGDKLFTGVNDTGNKFITGVNDTSE